MLEMRKPTIPTSEAIQQLQRIKKEISHAKCKFGNHNGQLNERS